MGFRNGAYARVWSAESVSDKVTKVRLSVSKKNKQTGEYDQDFGGFVKFVGSANAKAASMLNDGDRIKLGEVDVTNRYDKEQKKEYIDYVCFAFENGSDTVKNETAKKVDEGEVDDDEIPF